MAQLYSPLCWWRDVQPPRGTRCLVTASVGTSDYAVFVAYSDNRWRYYYYGNNEITDVIAWMPMPAPAEPI